MPWNVPWPDGAVSVRANRVTGVENTNYIQDTMGTTAVGTVGPTVRDHFWNVGPNQDGRHRFIQSVGYTNGVNPADPDVGTAMDGVIYLKQASAAIGRVEGFYQNTNGIYQFIPSFLQGTTGAISTPGYVTVVAVPANVYGDIYMWATVDGTVSQQRYRTASGFFRSNATTVSAWAVATDTQGDGDYTNALKFGNGTDTNNLIIQARTSDATTGLLWNYRITYRAI